MGSLATLFIPERQDPVRHAPFLIFLCSVILLFSPAPVRAQTNANIASQFNLLDAVRATLTSDPVIKLEEKNVKLSRGILQQASGQFDTTLRAAVERSRDYQAFLAPGTPNVFTRFRQDDTAYRVSADKQLRSGILLSPGIEFDRLADNTGQDTLNRGSLNFLIQVPLARGLGAKATAAAERAARLDWEASNLNLRHTLSLRVFNTTVAYWNYVAASQRLKIIGDSEKRAERLVAQVQALVKADEQPEAELDQLIANFANTTASRLSAEQALMEARNQLGISIGTPFAEIFKIALPSDRLPEYKADLLPPETDVQKLCSLALTHRQDIAAAAKSQQSAAALVTAAKNGLKPRVDLTLKGGYAGAEGGSRSSQFFTPFGENIQGANGFAGLSFEFPPANNSARGIYAQREAIYESSVIRTQELTRSTQADVYVGLERLRSGAQQLGKSLQATQLYDKAVVNEKVKLSLSTATIIDVLTLEDRLTAASLNYISAQNDYSTAVVRLRFLTGTILTETNNVQSLNLESLTTIPKFE
ncbi:MAG: outer rane efflux protein [Verrucomicrobiales bacterium]|nr:outer rane efflux protein [Verrucomicrobiales bacterium]